MLIDPVYCKDHFIVANEKMGQQIKNEHYSYLITSFHKCIIKLLLIFFSFMPDGIYLNARTLGVQGLAEEMASIILDQQRYFDFFKWHGYYTYSDTYNLESNDTYTVCNVCAKLNKLIQGSRSTIYTNITNWWNSTDSHNELQTQTMIYYTTPNGTICSPEKAKDTRIIPSILRSITTYFKDILFD